MQQKIGLITSGGDCAGLNAAIRAVVTRANLLGHQVLGIGHGMHGFYDTPPSLRILTHAEVLASMMRTGGTILGAASKGKPSNFIGDDNTLTPLGQSIVDGIKLHGLTAVISVGGDGSFGILSRLSAHAGFRAIGIPKTIDNDVWGTDAAIGFDTAVSVAVEALDRLHPTAASHERVMVLEVMGRDAGHIALASGIAGGADVILIPEVPYKIEHVIQKLKDIRASGRKHAVLVVSEATTTESGDKAQIIDPMGRRRYGGIGQYIADQIMDELGWEARPVVLGHVQRGAEPTYRDRLLATMLGTHAVDLVHAGQGGRMVAWHNGQVIDIPLHDAIATYQRVDLDGDLVKTARAMGISLGDA